MKNLLEFLKWKRQDVINPLGFGFENLEYLGFKDPKDYPKDKTVEDLLEDEIDKNEDGYVQGQLNIIYEIMEYIEGEIEK